MKFRPRKREFTAVQFTGDNQQEIANWLDASSIHGYGLTRASGLHADTSLRYPLGNEDALDVGDWVLRTDDRFVAMTADQMRETFEPVPDPADVLITYEGAGVGVITITDEQGFAWQWLSPEPGPVVIGSVDTPLTVERLKADIDARFRRPLSVEALLATLTGLLAEQDAAPAVRAKAHSRQTP